MLVGFHAFTGCDQTGKCNDNAKQSCWNTFITYPKKAINAFMLLGNSIKHPTNECVDGITIFVLNLYCKNRPADISNLSKLQRHMFSENSLNLASHHQHFQHSRIRYTEVITWLIYGSPLLVQIQFMADKLSAPQSVIELSMCSCKKTNCDSLRCNMCQCLNCSNIEFDKSEFEWEIAI